MGEADAGTPSFEMTWSSTTSSGYCSQEDSDSELEQFFTARTSLGRRPRRDQVGAEAAGGGPGAIAGPRPCPVSFRGQGSWAAPRPGQRGCRPGAAGGTVCRALSAWVLAAEALPRHRPVRPGGAATWRGADQGSALSAYD